MNIVIIIWILIFVVMLAIILYKTGIVFGGLEETESTRVETKSSVVAPVELIA